MPEPVPGQIPDSVKPPIAPKEARPDFGKMPARDLATYVAQKLEAAKKATDPETSKDLLREAVRIAGIGSARSDIQRGYIKPFQEVARSRLYDSMEIYQLLGESSERIDDSSIAGINEADYLLALALVKGADQEGIFNRRKRLEKKREEVIAEDKRFKEAKNMLEGKRQGENFLAVSDLESAIREFGKASCGTINMTDHKLIEGIYHGLKKAAEALDKIKNDDELVGAAREITRELETLYERKVIEQEVGRRQLEVADLVYHAYYDFLKLDSLILEEESSEESRFPSVLKLKKSIIRRVVTGLTRDDFVFSPQLLKEIMESSEYQDKDFMSLLLKELEPYDPGRCEQIFLDIKQIREQKEAAKIVEEYFGEKEYSLGRYSGRPYGTAYTAVDSNGRKILLAIADEGLNDLEKEVFYDEWNILDALANYQKFHNLTVNGEILTPIPIGRGEAESGRQFYAMSFPEGGPIDQIFEEYFTEEQIITIGDQLCRVSEALEGIGKVHYLLKTKNIFWNFEEGKITVNDQYDLAEISKEGTDKDLISIATTMLGLLNVKQEQLKEEGVVEALEVVSASPKLKSFLAKALNSDPSQRYQSAAQMRQDLEVIAA